MKLTKTAAALEAVLFACGDPVEPDRLAAAVDIDKGSLSQLADTLNEAYEKNGSAFTVLRLGGMFQLAARTEFHDVIKRAAETKKNAPLSPAAMEVLTIIAYNQPVTKSFVEHIRGIDSSNVVNSLVEKNLLEEAGRLDVPGRPIAYRTTSVFLRCFGLESLDDLPPLPGHVKEDFEPLIENPDDDTQESEQ